VSRLPRAAVADQRFLGVVIGLVVDADDPEGIGRVKVRLPWYASGYEEWARVAQIYAGDGFGSTWVPDPNAEVLVAFAHGDMRWPYVVGCLHGKVDTPPYSRSDGSDVRTLMTPSGSELSFDETNGVVLVRTATGASIRLEEQTGAITLEATSKISLKATDISIEATGQVTVSGQQIALN
jgi:uncharacterized protein involved in type VI secretion and phage assembly